MDKQYHCAAADVIRAEWKRIEPRLRGASRCVVGDYNVLPAQFLEHIIKRWDMSRQPDEIRQAIKSELIYG